MTPQLTNYTTGRLYTIAYFDEDWLLYQPGYLPDGNLAILGMLPQSGCPREPGPYQVDPLLGLFFSSDGHYLRHDILPIPVIIDPEWKLTDQIEFLNIHLADARTRWSESIGFTPGTIKVQYFSLPELMIGIADWPSHLFPDRLWAGSDPERIAELAEDENHREWIAGGLFVFYWGNDFWMNPDGTIGAS